MKSKWRIPRLSLKPIKVYKVIVVRKHYLYNEFETYLYRAVYSLGKTYRAEWSNYNVINSLFKCITRSLDKDIDSGFFHSFKNYDDAKALMEYEQNRGVENNKFAVIECIVPQFTLYYKGNSFEGEEIASRRIHFKKIINYNSILKEIHKEQ